MKRISVFEFISSNTKFIFAIISSLISKLIFFKISSKKACVEFLNQLARLLGL